MVGPNGRSEHREPSVTADYRRSPDGFRNEPEHRLWTNDVDEALVERLITAMQRAIGVALQDRAHGTGEIQLPAPDLATALLTMLATIVEPSPECGTPSGMRRTAEAVGRELHLLMRDARRLKLADAVETGKVS